MRVVVVESDPEVAAILAAALAEDGHQAVVLPHRRTALGALRSQRFDVCVCDGFGPDTTQPGPADRAELAALQAAVPVVLCTAHNWALELGATRLGVAAVVGKPFDLDHLLPLLQAVARRRP